MQNRSDALERAKVAAGGAVALARALGITPQALWQWETIPVARVLEIEKLTGIARHEQRPDIYPPPSDRAPPTRPSRARAKTPKKRAA